MNMGGSKHVADEKNYNINSKRAFCWLTLHNCIIMHGTKKNMKIRRPSDLMREAELAVEIYRSKGHSHSRLLVGGTKV